MLNILFLIFQYWTKLFKKTTQKVSVVCKYVLEILFVQDCLRHLLKVFLEAKEQILVVHMLNLLVTKGVNLK